MVETNYSSLKLRYSASEKMEKQLQKEHVCFFLGEFSGAMFSFMEGRWYRIFWSLFFRRD